MQMVKDSLKLAGVLAVIGWNVFQIVSLLS